MLVKTPCKLAPQKPYSEKSVISSLFETTMVINKLIQECKFEELRALFSESKVIDSKMAEDALISILRSKERQIPMELFEAILRFNPDLNRADNDNKNALMYAAERGDLELVKMLIREKANPDFLNRDNKPALFYAIDNKENRELPEIVKFLGPLSNVDVVSKEGDTMLTKAVERQFIQVVGILLELKADPNIKNLKNNDTPLHISLKNRNQKIFMMLLERNCDVKARNKKNISALDLIENDEEFKNLYDSWLSLQPKRETPTNETLEDGSHDRKKKKKSMKSINKNTIKVLPDKKLEGPEIFSEKKVISNILEQITEKSTTSKQSFNSKSEENQAEGKTNNSKDQSMDSKISESLENQPNVQKYITEIEKNKLEIKALNNTIKSNINKIKDLESKLDSLKKENSVLKEINEALKLKSEPKEKNTNVCTSDVQMLLVEKTLNPEKKIHLFHEQSLYLNFEKEIIQFYDKVTEINNSNKPIFEKLIENFKTQITELFPEAKINLFGSYATDLCLPYSDIDLVVELPTPAESKSPRADIEKNLQKIEENLKNDPCIQESKTVFSASIPLIKIVCKDEFFKKKVDITIQDSNHNGLKCVALIKDYIKEYPLLKYLVLTLKHLLFLCDLSDSYSGGLSSYALILMVGSFLQLKKCKNMSHEDNPGLLAQILHDFLFFFGKKFNYFNTVINPALNSVCPYVFGTCFWSQPQEGCFIPHEKLRIIDPISEKNDVGRCTFHISAIKNIFYNAYMAVKINYCLETGFGKEEKEGNDGQHDKNCACNLKKMFYLPKIFGV